MQSQRISTAFNQDISKTLIEQSMIQPHVESNFVSLNKNYEHFVYLVITLNILNQTTNFVQGIFYKLFTQTLMVSESFSNLCYALSSIVYMFSGIIAANLYQKYGYQYAAYFLVFLNTISYLLVFISGYCNWAFALTIIFNRTNTGMQSVLNDIMSFGIFDPFKGIQYNIWLQYGNLVCIILSTVATQLFFDENNIKQIFYILFTFNLACYYVVYKLKGFRFQPSSQQELLVKEN